MKKQLTAKFIDGIKDPAEEQTFTDSVALGLSLRVYPSGKKVWWWLGRIEGKAKKIKLGTYVSPKMGMQLSEAREAAGSINDARDSGEPIPFLKAKPGEAAEEAPVDPRAHMTCDWLFDLYMDNEGSKKKSGGEKRKMYDREIKPVIGDRHIDTIEHDDLAGILHTKYDAGFPIASNRIKALISRWFRWAVTKGRATSGLKVDPAQHLVCLAEEGDGRRRYLSDYEIGVFFQALAEVEESFAETLTVILYTGMRRAEAFGLTWEEINIPKKAIDINGERIKNGLDLVLGLPDTVWGLIEARRQRTGNYKFVWPATRSSSEGEDDDEEIGDTTKAVTGWGKPMAALNESCNRIAAKDKKSVERFTIHDLRRTLSSGMNSLMGEDDKPLIAGDIVERVINHRIGGVKGIYNRYGYFAEKKAALRIWAEHLDPIRTSALEAIQQSQNEATSSPDRIQAAA